MTTGAWTFVDGHGAEHTVTLGEWRFWLGAPDTFRCDGLTVKFPRSWRSTKRRADFVVDGHAAAMTKEFVLPRANIRVKRALGGSVRNLPATILAYALGGAGAGGGASAATATSGMLMWGLYELTIDGRSEGTWVVTVIDGAPSAWSFVPPGGSLPDGTDDAWRGSPFRVTDRWSGEYGGLARAADDRELASLIGEFCGRARRENPDPSTWYRLGIQPEHRRMFSVSLEPSRDGVSIREARIPLSEDKGRMVLAYEGWPIRKSPSGTPYFTRSFAGGDGQPDLVAADIRRAYVLVYDARAADISWELHISPYRTAGPV